MSQSFPPPPPLQPQAQQYGLEPQPTAYPPVPPPMPLPMPPQTLGYATPHMMPSGYGVWRQGDRIVTMREVDLGDLCVKCGAPSDGWRWNKTLYWHEPWVYALILPGLLIYAICALVLRKSAKVSVGLCPVHRKRHYLGVLFTWVLSLAGLGGFIGGIYVSAQSKTPEWGIALVFLSFVLIIAAVVVSSMMARVLVPKRIDDHYAWLGGANEPFLRTLPSTP